LTGETVLFSTEAFIEDRYMGDAVSGNLPNDFILVVKSKLRVAIAAPKINTH